MSDADEERESLRDRLSALGRRLLRRRIPFVQQLTQMECGVACLAMSLGYHGRHVPLSELRPVLPPSATGGVDAQSILEAAAAFGLDGRGLSLEVEDLELLEPGSILHWDFVHFVVLDHAEKDAVWIVDPAAGVRRIPIEQVRKSFTGVALQLEPGEGFTKSAPQPRRVWRYLIDALVDSGVWLHLLLASLVLQVLGMAFPVFMGLVIERIVPMADRDLLWVVSIGLGTVVLFVLLMSLVRGHLLLVFQTKVDLRLALGSMEHLLSLPLAFFHQRTRGDILQRWQAAGELRDLFSSLGLSGVVDAVMVLFYLVVLVAVSPLTGLVSLAVAAAQMAAFVAFRTPIVETNNQTLQAVGRAYSYGTELITGIETLKVSGAEDRALERWSGYQIDAVNAFIRRERVKITSSSTLSALRVLAPLVVLGFGTSQVLAGRMSLGAMLAVVTFAAGFLVPFAGLVNTVVQLQLAESQLLRLGDILAEPPEQDRGRTRPPGRLRGHIALQRVSFRYSPLLPDVVKGVEGEIKPGQFIALVGRSGSGKSSLSSLLLGLYRPTEGQVLFDGIGLDELDLRLVRQQLGIVPQAPVLFNDTLRANICSLDSSASFEQVVEAAKAACIHEDIRRMPLGYDTVVSEGGASLSGGQRQRIALARALIRRPSILLLDEATSALDAVTERAVQENLARHECTKIFITHSLPTIARSDEIWVMDDGVLVERGRHAQLMAKGRVYPNLVKAVLSGGELLRT